MSGEVVQLYAAECVLMLASASARVGSTTACCTVAVCRVTGRRSSVQSSAMPHRGSAHLSPRLRTRSIAPGGDSSHHRHGAKMRIS
jgi:hypothetical protein